MNYKKLNLIAADLKHIWHPGSQMKDLYENPPLIIKKAHGSYLYTSKGPVIDAISSWWCKSLGHGHPKILAALRKQLSRFEHVIAANTCHQPLVALGSKLAEITKKQHLFFASDGSSAVEVALKLVLQASQLNGFSERCEFIALKNGYHGETLGTLSVGDLRQYRQYYGEHGPKCHIINPLPYVNQQTEPLWRNAEDSWLKLKPDLEQIKTKVCAIVFEPIVQGAAGMLCYSADFLKKLAIWARQNGIYLIADEIMTGIGRTGKWLACEHAAVDPDLICLSKGLTGGTIPFSCVAIAHDLYELFYDDYQNGKSFLHSHTYSANPLGVAAALATLQTIETEGILEQAQQLGHLMHANFAELAATTGKLMNVRSVGAIVAADLVPINKPRLGFKLAQEALARGALLRPIGNTLYWLPPLNISHDVIAKLAKITLNAIEAVYI